MAITSFGFALPLMLLVVAVGADIPSILNSACNPQQIPSDSISLISVGDVFEAMVQNSYLNNYDFRTSSPGVNGLPSFYGYAHCDAQLSSDYCAVCVENLCNSIRATCPDAFGAQMQYGTAELTYCTIEYETYPI